MEVEIGNMGSVLVDSAGVGVVVGSGPVMVEADHSLFVPLVELDTLDGLLT